MKSFEDDQLFETHKLIYNHGKLIREEINGESKTVHLYNEKGQLIKTITGNMESLNKYNDSGLLISTFVYYDGDLFDIERYVYDFY